MIKIAWFQDMCPCCTTGGAQMNDLGMVKSGIRRGYDIQIITPHNYNLFYNKEYSLAIISNCVSFQRKILKSIVSDIPTVLFHHDLNFCNHRLFMPLDNKCFDCINKPDWEEIIRRAKLNIFLSPLHYEAYKKIFGENILGKKVCVPSCIDVDRWHPIEGVERKKNTVIGINALEKFKCRYNINKYAEEHPELSFTFVGTAPELRLNNCNYIGYTPNSDLPKLLSQFEYFIQLNHFIEPFCRAVTEAYLCRCKIIKNDNVGFFSYGDKELMSHPWNFENREEIREYLRQSSSAFWEEAIGIIDDKKIIKGV